MVLTDKRLRIAWTDYRCNYCNEMKFVFGLLRSYFQKKKWILIGSKSSKPVGNIAKKSTMEISLYSVVCSSSALNHYLSFQRKEYCRGTDININNFFSTV